MPVLSRFDTKNYYVHVHQKTNFVYSFLKLLVFSLKMFCLEMYLREIFLCLSQLPVEIHQRIFYMK